MTDRDYEAKRNKLICLAEKKANDAYGVREVPGYDGNWSDDWNRCYLGEMDRLSVEVGIVGENIQGSSK